MNFIKVFQALAYSRYRRDIKLNTILFSYFKQYRNENRNVYTNSKLFVKMYTEKENKYAYNIMESNGYTISLNTTKCNNVHLTHDEFKTIMQEKWSKTPPHYLFEIFPTLGVYCSEHNLCISNKIFDEYIDSLTDNIRHASDEELKNIFYSVTKWPETESIRTRNYIEIWAALDDECLSRMKTWTVENILSYVALFYMLNVIRSSEFTTRCLNKLATKARTLSPTQLVQTMFFIGVNRQAPFDMHNLEICIENYFPEFNLDELSIIAMGFFKSKTPIRNLEFISKLIYKIMENSNNIHEVSLAAHLKIIRYSMKFCSDDTIYRLLNVLQHEVPRLSIMCNVHIALLATSTLTLHKQCLNTIANNVIELISEARLKDLERLVLTYGTFNFKPDTKQCFLETILSELRKPERVQEIEKHGRSFACCVSYLGLLGIYPTDLMSKILSNEFLERTYGKHCFSYGKEILVIHNTAKIFCHNSNMNHLSDKAAVILAKKYTDYVPNEDYKKQYNFAERMFIDVVRILKEDRGDAFVKGDHILTHHQRGDIILCNSKEGQPLSVLELLDKKKFGLILNPPDNNLWVVLVIAGRNSVISKSNEITGPFKAKIRELRKLGFYPALVHWHKYSAFTSTEEKVHYIKSLIKQATSLDT